MNDTIKAILPWIGTALGGPLGTIAANVFGKAVGMDDSSVEAVKSVLSGMTPEELVAVKHADDAVALEMQKAGYDNTQKLAELEVRTVEAVNKTMQSEGAAEHWPTYSWRPFIGFMFGCYIASLWILPLFHVSPVTLTPETVMTIGGILGIASFFRGKAQADPNIPPSVQIPADHGIVKKLLGQG